ncbi:MAG: hypothetical protein ACLGG0_05885 [Bacteriovoracia bacterium]
MLQQDVSSTPKSLGKTPLESFVSSLKRTRSNKTLELHQKRLQFLAQNFDPFAGQVDNECQQILNFYSIQIQDPFQFTNLVLQMLDALEERTRSLSR